MHFFNLRIFFTFVLSQSAVGVIGPCNFNVTYLLKFLSNMYMSISCVCFITFHSWLLHNIGVHVTILTHHDLHQLFMFLHDKFGVLMFVALTILLIVNKSLLYFFSVHVNFSMMPSKNVNLPQHNGLVYVWNYYHHHLWFLQMVLNNQRSHKIVVVNSSLFALNIITWVVIVRGWNTNYIVCINNITFAC